MTVSSAMELGGNGPPSAGLVFSVHHWDDWVLEQAQRCFGVFSPGHIPNPPGHKPEWHAWGDTAWAGRLDSVTSSDPFQPYPFCILWFILLGPVPSHSALRPVNTPFPHLCPQETAGVAPSLRHQNEPVTPVLVMFGTAVILKAA